MSPLSVEALRATLRTYARPIAGLSVAVGIVCAGVSVIGFFGDRIQYCDGRSNPCTWVVVPESYPLPDEAKFIKSQKGNAFTRTAASLSGVILFSIAIASIASSARTEEEIEQQLEEQESREKQLNDVEAEIALQGFIEKLQFAQQLDLEEFKMKLGREKAQRILAENPDLIERFRRQPPEPKVVEQEEEEPSQHAKEPATTEGENNTSNSQPTQPATPSTPEEGKKVLHGEKEAIAYQILDGLVGSRRSTLLVGSTGAGKSVTEAYLLTKLFERYPKAEVWVIAQKNDSFCGLDKKKRVVLFDLLAPSMALDIIDRVHKIYDERRRLPEQARANLLPVRLILADWLSINQALSEMRNEEPVKGSKYLTKCADIIYNGRDMNVCLWVDLQSFNLGAIGLKADRNSRKNFNLVGLGNYYTDELGAINESYGVLENMIGDRNIVPEESEREMLLQVFRDLKSISMSNERPIIFTTLEPARVALLPDLRHYKPGSTPLVKLEGYTPEQLNKILALEFDIDLPKTVEQKQQSKPSKKELTDKHKAVIEYLRNNGARTVKQIADSRRLGLPETRELLNDLIQQELVEQDGEQYRITNN
jgi:SOS response regulatory protein OraA/RecX